LSASFRRKPESRGSAVARHSGEAGYAGKPQSGCSQNRNPGIVPVFVIPAKAGIQGFATTVLDSGSRGARPE